MSAVPGEIYLLDDKSARLRESESARYVLVLRLETEHAQVAYFSSRFDLLESGRGISIYKSCAEFPATGLKMDCYLVTEPLGRARISNLTDRRGKIEGHFKMLVEDWWGEPL